jgi:hypothetical protein
VNVMWTWLVVTMVGLVGCLMFGAWPMISCRRLAPAWRGLVGASCIVAGTAGFAGFCSATAWADSAESKAEAPAAEAPAKADTPASSEAPKTDDSPSASAPPAGSSSVSDTKVEAEDSSSGHSESEASAPASPPANRKPDAADAIEIEAPPEGVVIPPGRPSWVESPPMHVGEVHTTPVSSGPYARMQDGWHEFDKQIVQATDEYIVEHLGESFATQFIHYDAKAIRIRFLKPQNIYHEQITVSIGPMHQVHGLLEFGPDFRSELDDRWAQVTCYSRLTQVGLGTFALLALLSIVFGYFRVDNATRGYYTGRLQFLTAAAILAVVGVGVVAARWVVWM